MKILYIFPHPDDESFGPAKAMNYQQRQGHEVYLLTLTKGGATKQRHKLNLTIEEMGEVRAQEMQDVANVLKLASLTILDMPDGGLKEMDPRHIEKGIQPVIEKIRPDIIVSYPVYGISGFHDHLVMHAVIKRLYVQMKGEGADYLRRLAFFTLNNEEVAEVNKRNPFNIQGSEEALIDCELTVGQQDVEAMKNALDCYKTYKEVINKTGIKENISNKVYFEFFKESFDPPVKDITEGL